MERVEELLREWERHIDGGLTMVRAHTVTRPYGWVFFYDSKRYLKTRAFEHAIAGNGPVVVIAATGEVAHLGTAMPPFEALARFERTRGLEPDFWREMHGFSKAALEQLPVSERVARCCELSALLTQRMADATDLHRAAHGFVSELRALGHDLWSFDESDDFEIWCSNYAEPTGPGIVATFRREEVTAAWSNPTEPRRSLTQGMEVDWIACDMRDQLALISTAGTGLAPRFVEEHLESYRRTTKRILELPVLCEARAFPELAPRHMQWMMIAERGVYAFNYDARDGQYARVAVPSRAIKLRDLPWDLAAAVGQIRFQTVAFDDLARFPEVELDHLTL